MTNGEWEKRIKAIEVAARTAARYGLYRRSKDSGRVSSAGLGGGVSRSSSGIGGEPESTQAWIERLTREALGEAVRSVAPTGQAARPARMATHRLGLRGLKQPTREVQASRQRQGRVTSAGLTGGLAARPLI